MPASPPSTLRLLVADRPMQVCLGVYGLVVVARALETVIPERVGSALLPWIDTLLLSAPLVALLWGRGQLTRQRERRFWDLLAAAWGCWLLVEFLYFLEPELPFISSVLAVDALYVLYYLAFALAVDQQPHRSPGRSLAVTRRRLESAAGLGAIFGLLIYFGLVVLPEPLGLSLTFASRAEGLAPTLLVRLSLDLLILGRLVYAKLTSGERWARLYGLLASAMLLYGVRDLFSLLQDRGLATLIPAGAAYDSFLLVPGLLIIVAARSRHLPALAGPAIEPAEGSGRDRDAREPIVLGPVVVYSLVVPMVHFLLYPLGLLDPATRTAREVFCLFYVVILGALAWVQLQLTERERRRSTRALRETEKQLFRSRQLEEIGRLAGGIAHDFNNYLTVIQGYGELLRESVEDPDLRAQLDSIHDAADKAENLTRQLLAFGRRQALRPEPLVINNVIRETCGMLRSLLGEDVGLELGLDPAAGLVRADIGQTEQVLVNLAVNSRDAMPGGGTLTIRTGRSVLTEEEAARHGLEPGAYVSLVVSDTGCGMTEQTRSRAFEPFYTTKEHGRGTGLGLSTVYGVVTQTGGAISVESAPGEGTTVRLMLPAAEPTAGPEEGPVAARSRRAADALVLLVEDEEHVRRLAVRALARSGFRVVQAADGREALEVLAQVGGSVDLLVTDVMMPGIDGVALAVTMLDRCPGLRILFMSGYPAQTRRDRRVVLPESVPLLEKPFTPSRLVELALQALEGPPPSAQT